MIHSVLARNEYTITITVLATPWSCSVGVAAAGGRLGPATSSSSGTGPVHGTQGRGWSVVTTILRNTILSTQRGCLYSTFTLKNLFLRTRYLFSGTFSEYWVGVNMVTLTNSGFSFWRHCFLLGMPELVTSCSSGQSLPLTPRLSNLLKSCYKPQHCHCHPTPAPDPPPLVTGAGGKLAGPDLSPSAAIFILHWRLLR